MIALIIFGVIVILLLLLLFLPLTVDLAFDNKLVLKVRYSGITVYDNTKKIKPEISEKHAEKSKRGKKDNTSVKKDNFIKSTYKQKGLLGTIKYFSAILQIVLKKLWRVVKRLKFRKFKLDLSVATSDAAETAIQYGKICASVYPVLALLQTSADFKPDEINISADFEKNKSEFAVSIIVVTRLFNWLVAAISVLTQFLKLQRKEREKYERKQS